MIQDKALSMIGMAKKAGRINSGAFLTERSLQSGRSRLVVLAADASPNTQKKFRDKCSFRRVPIRTWGSAESLGASVGAGPRSVLSIDDEGFAGAVMKLIDNKNGPPE